ncbi:hypothetical protein PUNSTDRAFT_154759 [Punctularia strigosozonata HHB-11173 SS5]|uniref:uncharacterized protein n=1 Tax=Punctularia strigosozonata (strain HHB-11173) TaxID=741275 RepID=UPI0004416CEA|nr:uncharacterized protein PUNSTDRAFT_154759 [Punctularia strigosozonata HHB-11173 SS5]EIN14752.1 hypothetical protein PUNSTDRAFT_154759 [Punctularia strigosozonata HHB-11173 SS5]
MKSLALFATLLAVPGALSQASEYAQCGGIGWTGATACQSPFVCTELNSYYSQCLPGSPGATSSSASSTISSSSAPTPTPSGSLPRLGGVNTAGYDFSAATDGSFVDNSVSPPVSQYSHFASQGANLFRIPFAWSEMQPTLGGPLNQSFLSRYDATVNAALATGGYVIVDVHNYARLNGQIIGQGGPTNDQFASLWSLLAAHYASQSHVIFGVMNEPHDVPDLGAWATSVQAAVNAIRSAGATSQAILIPGSSWASAQALPTEAGPYLLKVTDPIGGTSKLLFDVHKYLDSDNSGTHADCVTNNVDVLTTLVNWLQQNGNRQAILSETGGGNTASCETDLGQELAYVKQAFPTLVGFSVWAAGAFDSTYILSVSPNPDGSDQPLWVDAVKPNLP